MRLSNTKIDLLGERLRQGSAKEGDLAELTEFEEEFREPLTETMVLAQEIGEDSRNAAVFDRSDSMSITGRFKQLRSIRDKLERELTSRTRLSQLQDIAGCRIVLPDMRSQETMLARISRDASWSIKDYRQKPRFGYRAVHAVRKVGRYRVELQVRTGFQQLWADLSEALDRQNPGLKYGETAPGLLRYLVELGDRVSQVENAEAESVSHDRDTFETYRRDLKHSLLRMLESHQQGSD